MLFHDLVGLRKALIRKRLSQKGRFQLIKYCYATRSSANTFSLTYCFCLVACFLFSYSTEVIFWMKPYLTELLDPEPAFELNLVGSFPHQPHLVLSFPQGGAAEARCQVTQRCMRLCHSLLIVPFIWPPGCSFRLAGYRRFHFLAGKWASVFKLLSLNC